MPYYPYYRPLQPIILFIRASCFITDIAKVNVFGTLCKSIKRNRCIYYILRKNTTPAGKIIPPYGIHLLFRCIVRCKPCSRKFAERKAIGFKNGDPLIRRSPTRRHESPTRHSAAGRGDYPFNLYNGYNLWSVCRRSPHINPVVTINGDFSSFSK